MKTTSQSANPHKKWNGVKQAALARTATPRANGEKKHA